MKPNSGHRDNSRLSCAAGDAQLLTYLGRHLRADAADDPAASLRLANFAPWPARSSWPHQRLSASTG